MKHTFTRRRFSAMAGAFVSSVFGSGCDRIGHGAGGAIAVEANEGRLAARAAASVATSAKGERVLGLDKGRDAILRVPANSADSPLPLLVVLHGAGGSGAGVLRRVSAAADVTFFDRAL